VEQQGVKKDSTNIRRREGAQASESCDRSLEINQQTKTTSRCKQWSKDGNGSTTWYMDGWREIEKDLYQEKRKKGKHPPIFLQHMGTKDRTYVETGYWNVFAGKVFEWQTNSTEAEETFWDGFGRNYTNSQSANQIRQDLICFFIAVITWNSNSVPLLEGLCSPNPCRFEFLVFPQLCRKAWEDRVEHSGNLAVERYGHISSACSKGIATPVTAAHHSI